MHISDKNTCSRLGSRNTNIRQQEIHLEKRSKVTGLCWLNCFPCSKVAWATDPINFWQIQHLCWWLESWDTTQLMWGMEHKSAQWCAGSSTKAKSRWWPPQSLSPTFTSESVLQAQCPFGGELLILGSAQHASLGKSKNASFTTPPHEGCHSTAWTPRQGLYGLTSSPGVLSLTELWRPQWFSHLQGNIESRSKCVKGR